MLRRLAFLPFLILAVVVGIGLSGCTQSEDIVTPISSTEITLAAERLPALPNGMVYEVWVADNTDTLSLGKFRWDSVGKRYLDTLGNEITPTFALHDDLLSYKSCFVSVEMQPDDNVSSPGPIMLIDNVTNPIENEIILRFPKMDSLWLNNAVFNLEATSDLYTNLHDGCGLWFAQYAQATYAIPDTLGVVFDSTPDFDTFIDPGTTARIPCQLNLYVVETTTISIPGPNFILRSPNADELRKHIGARFSLGYCVITVPDTATAPEHYTGMRILASVPPELRVARSFNWDFFNADDIVFPDVSRYGWKYKGWVLTPYLNSKPMTTRWRFTPPVWPYKVGGTNIFPGDTGVLLTTGTFGSIRSSDDADPYLLANPHAPFPGEDFLNSVALQAAFGIDSISLMPNSTGNIGTVFISLEPNNFVLDTTNFPLFVAVAELPSARSQLNYTFPGSIPVFLMRPWTRAVRGDTYGFPVIYVTITRR